jgi:large subunit ribosomal protein L21
MYAIVDIAGKQFKVQKDMMVYVHRLDAEEGSSVNFANILLASDGSGIKIGADALKGASIKATVLSHLKGDKVIVFKKKRRKGYRVKKGHRQYLTKIQINDISL